MKEEVKPTLVEEEIPNGKAEIRMINLLVDQSINLMNKYEREGRTNDYWKMQEVVDQSKKYKENLEKVLELNFDKPNIELARFCKDHKLNLDDPNVKKEFLKVRKEYLDRVNKFYAENLFLSPPVADSFGNNKKPLAEGYPAESVKKKKNISQSSGSKTKIKEVLETAHIDEKKKKSTSVLKKKKTQIKTNNNNILIISLVVLLVALGIALGYYYLPPIKFKF
jgi:hypothetical protein